MKYIKLFESDSLYYEVKYDDYTKNKDDSVNIEEGEIFLRDIFKHSISTDPTYFYIGYDGEIINGITFRLINKITISIYKTDDEYYFVCILYKKADYLYKSYYYYKCDTIDGFHQLVNDLKLI